MPDTKKVMPVFYYRNPIDIIRVLGSVTWLGGFLFLVIIIVVIILLVRAASGSSSSGSQYGRSNVPAQQNRALDILAERYAKGELSEDEYNKMKDIIGSGK